MPVSRSFETAVRPEPTWLRQPVSLRSGADWTNVFAPRAWASASAAASRRSLTRDRDGKGKQRDIGEGACVAPGQKECPSPSATLRTKGQGDAVKVGTSARLCGGTVLAAPTGRRIGLEPVSGVRRDHGGSRRRADENALYLSGKQSLHRPSRAFCGNWDVAPSRKREPLRERHGAVPPRGQLPGTPGGHDHG